MVKDPLFSAIDTINKWVQMVDVMLPLIRIVVETLEVNIKKDTEKIPIRLLIYNNPKDPFFSILLIFKFSTTTRSILELSKVRYTLVMRAAQRNVFIISASSYNTHERVGSWDTLHVQEAPIINLDRTETAKAWNSAIEDIGLIIEQEEEQAEVEREAEREEELEAEAKVEEIKKQSVRKMVEESQKSREIIALKVKEDTERRARLAEENARKAKAAMAAQMAKEEALRQEALRKAEEDKKASALELETFDVDKAATKFTKSFRRSAGRRGSTVSRTSPAPQAKHERSPSPEAKVDAEIDAEIEVLTKEKELVEGRRKAAEAVSQVAKQAIKDMKEGT